MRNEPWWVDGAETSDNLEMLMRMAFIAKVRVDAPGGDGYSLAEQLWFDAVGDGINTKAGKSILKISLLAAKSYSKRKP